MLYLAFSNFLSLIVPRDVCSCALYLKSKSCISVFMVVWRSFSLRLFPSEWKIQREGTRLCFFIYEYIPNIKLTIKPECWRQWRKWKLIEMGVGKICSKLHIVSSWFIIVSKNNLCYPHSFRFYKPSHLRST